MGEDNDMAGSGTLQETFRRDPYEKLKKYIRSSGYRLMDLFRDFDKDGSNAISRDEFERGLRVNMISLVHTFGNSIIYSATRSF